MSQSSQERWALRVLSGQDRRPHAALLRVVLRLIEPFYATVARVRNGFFRVGIYRARKLPRPTIAVGNLTTGGTGKTPLVLWLAEQLIARGMRPAILLRGYRAGEGGSDEERMLAEHVGERGGVVANPDRVAGAMTAIAQLPQPDVFVLDDAFQHRRAARDFDLLLVSASNPFGYEHVLPRGLLREPMRGMKRANAVVITRCNLADEAAITAIEERIRQHHPQVPIFHAEHRHTALRARDDSEMPIDELGKRRFLIVTGIADPISLQRQLQSQFPDTFAGVRTFPDHHDFTDDDLVKVRRAAAESNAHVLLTTEKDWVKISRLATARDGLPILRLELQLAFRGEDEQKLLALVLNAVEKPAAASSSPVVRTTAPAS
jgi:tetraacyldisaccharide 4'-kinase